MHVEFAVSAAEDFITKSWQLFVVIITMQRNHKFMLESIVFSTSLELTSINYEIPSIECKISGVFELDFTLNNHSVEDGGALID